jgi:hypothetical protein
MHSSAPHNDDETQRPGVEDMAWYRCSCGALKEAAPRFGDSIVSIYHLHRSERLDGGSTLVPMEEVALPAADREAAAAGGGEDD